MEIHVGMLVPSWGLSWGWIMATTSRALCKGVEDVEIFQVLVESTDSDVKIFSSEEEE